MQTMPKASCSQRNGEGRAAAARASIVMSLPFPAFLAKVLRDRRCRLSSRQDVGLHRALNLKQRLYRLISPNFCKRVHGEEAIINNAKLTSIVNLKLTRRRALAFACSCFAAGSLAISAVADDKPAPTEPPQSVETRHSVTLGNHSLDYRAIAETIGLTDQKSEPTASIFTVSYLAEPFPGERLWPTAQLLLEPTIRFLRARNRDGFDVYFRPYVLDHNAGYILVDLDDERS